MSQDDGDLPGLEPEDGDLPGLEPDDGDLPGLERGPAPEQPLEIHDVVPTTYDGLTNAELDEWFDTEYGGQDRFEAELHDLRKELAYDGTDLAATLAVLATDPDLAATLRALDAAADDGMSPSLAPRWKLLGGDAKASFRRYVNSRAKTTPPGKKIVIIGATLAALVAAAFLFFGILDSADSPPAIVEGAASTTRATAPPTTLQGTTTTTLAAGADAEGDVFSYPGITGDDTAEVAATDITATAYFFDDGKHVFQMKVRGDGEALAMGDVRWYNPRFIIQTTQGEFTIDVDASDGTARVIDSGPFFDPQQIEIDVTWLEPGLLQVAVTIPGLMEEATSFRTELTVRLADGTDYADDASFGE